MKRLLAAALFVTGLSHPAMAQDDPAPTDAVVSPAVEQLRHIVGEWDVTTTFYRDDGSSAGAFDGTYAFEWVMPDRIVKGMSKIPAFGGASGLLFYVRESTGEVEMVSVGPDGQLWTMTGPVDGETRQTPIVDMPDGRTLELRFTRFNVTPDRFESRMDRSTDGGETWVQGNHQLFVRRKGASTAVLDALRPLAGSCWRGTFGDGPAYDVMCVEEMTGGFLKSRHVVRGIDGSYSGETIYYADPANGETRFTYFTSLGAIQRGTIRLNDGQIEFPQMDYVARDGARQQMRGIGEFLEDGRYRATTSRLRDGEWEEPSVLTMARIECADWDAVMAGCD